MFYNDRFHVIKMCMFSKYSVVLCCDVLIFSNSLFHGVEDGELICVSGCDSLSASEVSAGRVGCECERRLECEEQRQLHAESLHLLPGRGERPQAERSC